MSSAEERAKRAAYMRKWNKSPAGIAYRLKTRAHHADYERQRVRSSSEHIAKRKEQNARYAREHKARKIEYARNNPFRRAAEKAIWQAIKKGRMIRPNSCENCQKNCKTEAHHYRGYEQHHWYTVKWLCHACHLAEHNRTPY